MTWRSKILIQSDLTQKKTIKSEVRHSINYLDPWRPLCQCVTFRLTRSSLTQRTILVTDNGLDQGAMGTAAVFVVAHSLVEITCLDIWENIRGSTLMYACFVAEDSGIKPSFGSIIRNGTLTQSRNHEKLAPGRGSFKDVWYKYHRYG